MRADGVNEASSKLILSMYTYVPAHSPLTESRSHQNHEADLSSQYHKVPDGSTVPLLSLGEDLERMSLGPEGSGARKDPAGEASKKGKVPTLGEVQKSLKVRARVLFLWRQLNECFLMPVHIAIGQDAYPSHH